jgi:DNA polymerase delta subunit 1
MNDAKRKFEGSNAPRPKRPVPADDEDALIDEAFGLEPELDDDLIEEPDADMEVDEGELGEAGRNWSRPSPPPLDPASQSLIFQQLEVDYNVAQPNTAFYPTDLKEVPIIRMFGVTEQGCSVCTFVHGFEPYFYVEGPTSFSPDDCEPLVEELNKALAGKDRSNNPRQCLAVQIENKQSIMYYQSAKARPFLKITMALPTLIAPCRSLIEHGFYLPWLSTVLPETTYESNVVFALRFMVDTSVVGGNWIELPAGKYGLIPDGAHHSHCQLEGHIRWDALVSHAPEGEWAKLAPFRILSVDIECQGRKGHFPEAQHDPVIQIASLVTAQGSTAPAVKNILTLKSCAPIPGAEVESFSNEKELLMRWRDLMLETDPDIIIGYNIINFDLPYLLDRATTLEIPNFWCWGRIKNRKVKMRDARFSSKAYGTHEYKEITIEGRVQFDLYQAIQRDYKLSSYSLNSVSAHFLGEQKEDVHHSDISKLQDGTAESRRRLAIYCLKDAYLPQRLVDKLMYMYNHVEMARVTGVPMSYLLARGQSIKVFSQILRKSRTRGLVVPNKKRQGHMEDGVAYEGATVLEPIAGYYDKPVATLDFASLYPSIMMAHNLCYTTLVDKRLHAQYSPGPDVIETPNGDRFVKSHKQEGLLPEILRELLAARKRARKDMAAADDPFIKAVLNGRQLALKISANSVYGFTGATIGTLPCLEISSSTTAYGRRMIDHTKKLVQEHYTKANGYPSDATVIYGDTDSVMVSFGVDNNAEAMKLGQEAADFVSATFEHPIKLEFEKVYNPYLLISKKRYAGLLWTKPEKWDKIDTKGIETVRRDNCLLVRNVISTCLDMILIGRDPNGAADYVRGIIAELLTNKLDLSLLVISKGLTQDVEDYAVKAGHVELAKKMQKRDPATAPAIGDRVPYVIVKAAKGAKAYEKAEDPIYALKNNLPIDTKHYLEHHLEKPLMRLFEPILKNPRELLTGAHTRAITVTTPSVAAGGIMKFAKKTLTCLSCKAPLSASNSCSGGKTLCNHCKAKEGEVYSKHLVSINELEAQFSALWTQCQRCQGSLHQDILCKSRDCPIFYRRMKVQKELNEAQDVLKRFDEEW